MDKYLFEVPKTRQQLFNSQWKSKQAQQRTERKLPFCAEEGWYFYYGGRGIEGVTYQRSKCAFTWVTNALRNPACPQSSQYYVIGARCEAPSIHCSKQAWKSRYELRASLRYDRFACMLRSNRLCFPSTVSSSIRKVCYVGSAHISRRGKER